MKMNFVKEKNEQYSDLLLKYHILVRYWTKKGERTTNHIFYIKINHLIDYVDSSLIHQWFINDSSMIHQWLINDLSLIHHWWVQKCNEYSKFRLKTNKLCVLKSNCTAKKAIVVKHVSFFLWNKYWRWKICEI